MADRVAKRNGAERPQQGGTPNLREGHIRPATQRGDSGKQGGTGPRKPSKKVRRRRGRRKFLARQKRHEEARARANKAAALLRPKKIAPVDTRTTTMTMDGVLVEVRLTVAQAAAMGVVL